VKFLPVSIPGLILIEPLVYEDSRGVFMELYRHELFRDAGIDAGFVQDNFARSTAGVLRGLHYQHPHGQGKLVFVPRGKIFDVAVDIRRGSPTFGQWYGCELSEENHRQFWIPEGFAHGYCVLSDSADVMYKCTDYYHPECEGTLLWNDPDIGIEWPVRKPLVSEKDVAGMRLKDVESLE